VQNGNSDSPFPSTWRNRAPFVVQRLDGSYVVGRDGRGGIRWDSNVKLARRWIHRDSAEAAARALGGHVVDLGAA
jgi:hypothetical protein